MKLDDNKTMEVKSLPLSSGEQAKIFIFILLMIPTIPAIAGILPAIFLIFGVVLLKKNNDFSAIETSAGLVIGYLWLAVLISGGISLYAGSICGTRCEITYGAPFFMAVSIAYIIIVKTLYLAPLRKHSEWVACNGIFSNSMLDEAQEKKGNDIRIIKGENLRSYSVADELSKWAKLRDEGVVSEQEFQEARTRILQSQ